MTFQSSPAPKDGRYGSACRHRHSIIWFQSSPAPKDGRYRNLARMYLTAKVSILARPEGRALRRRRLHGRLKRLFQSSPAPKDGRYFSMVPIDSTSLRFQSSPAPKDGRYASKPSVARTVLVSILARPEGRALQP